MIRLTQRPLHKTTAESIGRIGRNARTARKLDERGASVISATIGAAMMLLSLLTATHVIVLLHQRSMVRAVAVDAVVDATRVGGTEKAAADTVHRLLGPSAQLRWSTDGPDLVIHVEVRSKSILRHGPLSALRVIRMEARSRREGFR